MRARYCRFGLKINEVYFKKPDVGANCDITSFSCFLSPESGVNNWKEWQTLVVELSQSQEKLIQQLDSGTRYEIRRAEKKDHLAVYFYPLPTLEQVGQFCDFYDAFAITKSLKKMFRRRIKALARSRLLAFSEVRENCGTILAQHIHVWNKENAVLLYSSSHPRCNTDASYRALIGRANRFLHWQDFLFFKNQGVLFYDLGGIDPNHANPDVIKITQFKMKLGGSVKPRYTRYESNSWLGVLALSVARLFYRGF